MRCPRCRHDHPPVSFAEWAWLVRDAKPPKPSSGQLGVLFMIGSRMDPVTGCGWTRREDVMADAGVKRDSVTRATDWAVARGLLCRLVRGHRLWDGAASHSLWALTDPEAPFTRAQQGAVEQDTRTQEGVVESDSRTQEGAVEMSADNTQGRNRAHSRAQQGAANVRPGHVRPGKDKDLQNPPGSAQDMLPGMLVLVPEVTGEVVPASAARPLTAQTLIAEWLDARAERPPQRTIGQVSKRVKALLDEGIAYERVRQGLADWHRKGVLNASTLDSFVNAAQVRAANGNGAGARPGQLTARERDQAGAALAEHYRRLEAMEGT